MPENYIGFQDPTDYTNLGTSEDAQKRVFGEYSKKDLTDYSSLAYTALMKQQEQAFTTAMYNYNNWYNSDEQRMKRRLAAGLNPYGLDGSAASSPASAPSAPASPRSAGLGQQQQQRTLGAIGQLIDLAGMANQMYELMTFKGPSMLSQSEANKSRSFLSDIQATRLGALMPEEVSRLQLYNKRYGALSPLVLSDATARNDWLLYYIYGPGMGPNSPLVENSPRAMEQGLRIREIASHISQLEYMVKSLYPSQVSRNKALEALDKYRQSLMEGQNDAILNISTGNDTADAWLRFLAYKVSGALEHMVPSFGYSGKLP